MQGHFLVLYPGTPGWAPASFAYLTDELRGVGFIGEARGPRLFNTGPEYLGLVTYLGCSPQVALGENDAATTICINGIYESPRFLHGDNLKLPRCPECRKALARPAAISGAEAMLQCNHCGHAGTVCEFDWRRSAACARLFIEISNVFESEAVPGEMLADCLLQATGEDWDYCYVRKVG